MLDASIGGAFLCKSYEECYKLIDSITANTYQWHVTRATINSTQKKFVGVHEVTETTTLAAQLAQIHKMMKNLMTPEVTMLEPANMVSDVSTVACVYCGGAHIF